VGDAEPEKFGYSGKIIRQFDLLKRKNPHVLTWDTVQDITGERKNSVFYIREGH
jgi:hypothetical protein